MPWERPSFLATFQTGVNNLISYLGSFPSAWRNLAAMAQVSSAWNVDVKGNVIGYSSVKYLRLELVRFFARDPRHENDLKVFDLCCWVGEFGSWCGENIPWLFDEL
jgi:hypothetical protein